MWQIIKGKQVVFSPLIGFPLTLIGWPQMLYADLIHRETLGFKPYFILTLIVTLIIVMGLICQAITQAR